MRYVAILGIVCLGTLTWVSGCSDGTEGSGGAGGNGMSSSSSSSSSGESSSSSGGGSGGGMASSSSSSSGGGMAINGCDQATAMDMTGSAMVKVTFGADFKYTPACVRVKKGTDITFEGDFGFHPLVGGEASLPPKPDSASPIKHTTTGTAATFKMDLAGTYPYYCENHFPSMAGAVFVE
jgi:plastocyanin